MQTVVDQWIDIDRCRRQRIEIDQWVAQQVTENRGMIQVFNSIWPITIDFAVEIESIRRLITDPSQMISNLEEQNLVVISTLTDEDIRDRTAHVYLI